MTNDNNQGWQNSLLFRCLLWGGLGLILYLGVNLPLYDQLLLSCKASSPNLYTLLLLAKGTLGTLGQAGIAVAVIVYAVKTFFGHLWHNFLEEQYNKFIGIVGTNLGTIASNVSSIGDTIASNVSHIGDTFDAHIKKNSGPLAFHDCRSREDFKKHVQHAYKELYGYHSIKSGSLVSFVADRLLDGFYCDPHRSKIKKQIILSTLPDRPGYLGWREVTDFHIHHVGHDDQNHVTKFPLTMTISSYAPGMPAQDWARVASLFVLIEGKDVISDCGPPELKKQPDGFGFFCWAEDDWIYLRFAKEIELSKEWTAVHVEEKTINSEEDFYYTANTTKPICGQVVDFELPDGFCFTKQPFVSPNLLFNGLPDRIKGGLHKEDYVDISKVSETKYRIEIKDWILPGVTMQIFWRKKQPAGGTETQPG